MTPRRGSVKRGVPWREYSLCNGENSLVRWAVGQETLFRRREQPHWRHPPEPAPAIFV